MMVFFLRNLSRSIMIIEFVIGLNPFCCNLGRYFFKTIVILQKSDSGNLDDAPEYFYSLNILGYVFYCIVNIDNGRQHKINVLCIFYQGF